MSNQVELLAAVRHRLETRFGAPVSLEVPEVDWDRRLVVRATLVDGRRAFVKMMVPFAPLPSSLFAIMSRAAC